MGQDICRLVSNFLNSEEFSSSLQLEKINHTFVVLIPKRQSPSIAQDFRLISLCNVIYKIISKVLVNRMKKTSPFIIDGSQSAFILDRMIFDNIIVAHETIHAMQTKKNGKTGFLIAKLDISKAYDRIEWSFLEGVMVRMGFSIKRVTLVMNRVKLVIYFAMVNGRQSDRIIPSKD